ncbi:MAG: pantoate--beta-alanine ligase [Blastocatellia bacterium]
MEIISRAAKMHSVVEKLTANRDSIGFVPTMGALHDGHLSLVREARRMSDAVVVSIFVNPAQFRAGEDYEKYPRDVARDVDMLLPLGVDYVFTPAAEEIYPKSYATYVNVEHITDNLEGSARPGHFRGVATVLTILFNIVRPQFVFMGQKDAQQTVVVKKMVRDLHQPLEIVVCPTTREADGLAMSSRNRYLTPAQRQAAPVLRRALQIAEEKFAKGERGARKIIQAMTREIESQSEGVIEYISISDTERLQPLDDLSDHSILISLAVRFGQTRLIDNTILNDEAYKSRSPRLKLG